MHAQSLHSCPTLCDLIDCRLPGSFVHGIFPARILEWVAMPSLQGIFPNPGIEFTSPVSLALQADSLPLSCWGSPQNMLNKYNSINKFALGLLILKEYINYSLREEYTGFNAYLKK